MGEMHAYRRADIGDHRRLIGPGWAARTRSKTSAVGCPVIVGQLLQLQGGLRQAIEVDPRCLDDIRTPCRWPLEIIADPIRRKAMSAAGSMFHPIPPGRHPGAPWT